MNRDSPLFTLSISQFLELLDEHYRMKPEHFNSTTYSECPSETYVYGLRGIRDLFGVSHDTAQRYKNTFLRPAVRQNGRKILVDRARALELFDKYKQRNV